MTNLAEGMAPQRQVLYMKAVCHRYLEEYELALGALRKLKALSPENGRAYQEEGHVYRSLGESQKAITSFERATQYNPALEASLKSQLELLDEEKQPQRYMKVRSS